MAIEARDFTEKDELIKKFYNVRAGLSVIAEENQKIKNIEKTIADLSMENDKNNKAMEQAQRTAELKYNQENLTYEKRKKDIESNLADTEKELDIYEAKLIDLNKKRKFEEEHIPSVPFEWGCAGKIFLTIIIISCFIALFIPLPDKIAAFLDFNTVWGKVFWITTTLLLTFGIPGWLTHSNAKDEKARQIKAINEEIEGLERNIKREKEYIEEIKTVLNSLTVPIKPNGTVILNQYNEEIELLKLTLDKYIVPLAVCKVKSIRQYLIEYIGDILTEDDWKNVDLLIFYLNTGRADTLKEALQLVDRQRQTDQIVRAIETASDYIAKTIRENTIGLANVVVNCFSGLNDQIQKNHEEMLVKLNETGKQIEQSSKKINLQMSEDIRALSSIVKKQGDMLVDAEHFNTSLLEHANRNSDKLMDELLENKRYWQ